MSKQNMFSKNEGNQGFTCGHCGEAVAPAGSTARNHCPHCLWSRHVDDTVPGDRASQCSGLMRPAAVYQKHGKWIVVHECTECAKEQPNKCAEDDNCEGIIDLTKLPR